MVEVIEFSFIYRWRFTISFIVVPLLHRLSSNCELRSSRGTFYFDDHLDLARKPSHTANSNFYIHDINAESSTNSQTNNEVSQLHGLTYRFTDLANIALIFYANCLQWVCQLFLCIFDTHCMCLQKLSDKKCTHLEKIQLRKIVTGYLSLQHRIVDIDKTSKLLYLKSHYFTFV